MPIPATATLSGPGGAGLVTLSGGGFGVCFYQGCLVISGVDYYIDPLGGTQNFTCGQGNIPTNGDVAVWFNISMGDFDFSGGVQYRCCELIIDGAIQQFVAQSACDGNGITPRASAN